jgi:hypothetical protein
MVLSIRSEQGKLKPFMWNNSSIETETKHLQYSGGAFV